MDTLSFSELLFAIAGGNMMAGLAAWGLWEMNRKGADAPRAAFAGFLVPVIIVGASAWFGR